MWVGIGLEERYLTVWDSNWGADWFRRKEATKFEPQIGCSSLKPNLQKSGEIP